MLLSMPGYLEHCDTTERRRATIDRTRSWRFFGGKHLRKTILILVIVLVLATTLVVFASTTLWARLSGAGVRPVVIVEIGSEVPDAGVFLFNTADAAEYAFSVEEIKLDRIGDIPLSIIYNDEVHDVTLRVTDTIPPSATPHNQITVVGQTLLAENFVTDITDATEVSVTYKRTPDFTRAGISDVTIVLEDQGRNKTELTARLCIFGIKQSITVEAGVFSIAPQEFLVQPPGYDGEQSAINISFISGVNRTHLANPGNYDVVIKAQELFFDSTVTVVDTLPPTASPVDRAMWIGKTAEPSYFVADPFDVSEFSMSFKTPPDFTTPGNSEVTVILEDIWGNASEVTSTLLMMEDTVPPVISGAVNQTVFLGDSVSYRSGVSAYDNADGEIDFTVDSSAVNTHRVGNYSVTYSAVDSSGNRATRTVTISVIELSYDLVYEIADSILESITTPDMSLRDKAFRIHTWIRANVIYASNRERVTLRAAYNGFRTRQGDCFTFYALSEVMLTRAGIDNMRITRVGGRTQHYWNLINIGTGWYHFDTNPIRTSINTFMFTSVQAVEYTRIMSHIENFYVFDRSLYPPIVGDDELYGDAGADPDGQTSGELADPELPGTP